MISNTQRKSTAARAAIFRWLLQHSDAGEFAAYVAPFSAWLDRHGCINDAWIKPEVFRLFQRHGYHLTRNHFYGTLPDTRDMPESWWEQAPYREPFSRLRRCSDMDELFERVLVWGSDLRDVPRQAREDFYWNNPTFPPLDALVLYGMLREYRPRRYLEIGCGFSTDIARRAARITGTAVHCIEPFPGPHLLAHAAELTSLTQTPVQEVDLGIFDELQANDMLFIDTTHSVKLRSDVNHLVLQVLPRLAPGVVIHIHDIFLPYEYPRRWFDEIGIFWNEQYLLLAYLLDNPHIELLLPNYDLSIRHQDSLRRRLESFDIWNITENLGGARGASFWLRKL